MAAVQPQQPDKAGEVKTAAEQTKANASAANSVPVLRGQVAENSQHIQDLADLVAALQAEIAQLKGRER